MTCGQGQAVTGIWPNLANFRPTEASVQMYGSVDQERGGFLVVGQESLCKGSGILRPGVYVARMKAMARGVQIAEGRRERQ